MLFAQTSGFDKKTFQDHFLRLNQARLYAESVKHKMKKCPYDIKLRPEHAASIKVLPNGDWEWLHTECEIKKIPGLKIEIYDKKLLPGGAYSAKVNFNGHIHDKTFYPEHMSLNDIANVEITCLNEIDFTKPKISSSGKIIREFEIKEMGLYVRIIIDKQNELISYPIPESKDAKEIHL